MRISILLLAIILMAVPSVAQDNGVPESETGHYGEPVPGTIQAVKLSEAVATERVDQPCVVMAEVVDVCSAKGCWIVLKDGDVEVRVSFKDYGFFVPSSLKGKTVRVQGVLSEERISEADRRHYAEDAGMSDEQIEQIVGDTVEFTFEATGVQGQ